MDRKKALSFLKAHVQDKYQLFHAQMVATTMEAYAEKYDKDKDLWYITGLLHDVDYDKFPKKHPTEAIEWLKKEDYPEKMINAIGFHAPQIREDYDGSSKLAQALLAIDELTGIAYAYALMRPSDFEGMKANKLYKKFKDESFAAKVDREEIKLGVDLLGLEMKKHMENLIEAVKELKAERY
jgi:putative nucleotidyltransferase with HDIG domain